MLLRDGKPATDMNMNVLEKLLLSRGLKEIEHTDIYGLLKEFGVIPTTDENRDVPVPATGAVWPGIPLTRLCAVVGALSEGESRRPCWLRCPIGPAATPVLCAPCGMNPRGALALASFVL